MSADPATLVVTDLDGTVWDGDVRSHPAVIDAIREVQSRPDVALIAATGRRRNSAGWGLRHNGFQLPAVLLNGSTGYNFVTETAFHEICFRPEDLDRTFDVLFAHELSPVCYLTSERALAGTGVTTSVKHLDTLQADLDWATNDELYGRRDVVGMSMLGIAEESVTAAYQILAGDPAVSVAGFADELYPPFSVMLAPSGVNKAAGVEAYCRTHDVRPGRVIAIGDAGNDLPLLEVADVAVVVEGADERCLALADFVIPRPESAGWTRVLDLLD